MSFNLPEEIHLLSYESHSLNYQQAWHNLRSPPVLAEPYGTWQGWEQQFFQPPLFIFCWSLLASSDIWFWFLWSSSWENMSSSDFFAAWSKASSCAWQVCKAPSRPWLAAISRLLMDCISLIEERHPIQNQVGVWIVLQHPIENGFPPFLRLSYKCFGDWGLLNLGTEDYWFWGLLHYF